MLRWIEKRRIVMTAKVLRERLIEEIEKLPENRLREVLDFVGYLRTKETREAAARLLEDLDPQKGSHFDDHWRSVPRFPIPGDS